MPFIQVYIHFVWSTKNREPFLDTKDLRLRVWKHIIENAQEKSIFIDQISGYHDHCHCLVSLAWNQTLSDIMKLIKGESARWINKEKLVEGHFGWQDEYYAVSVSESVLPKVREYILNQEERHKDMSFADECEKLERIYGFKRIKD